MGFQDSQWNISVMFGDPKLQAAPVFEISCGNAGESPTPKLQSAYS